MRNIRDYLKYFNKKFRLATPREIEEFSEDFMDFYKDYLRYLENKEKLTIKQRRKFESLLYKFFFVKGYIEKTGNKDYINQALKIVKRK